MFDAGIGGQSTDNCEIVKGTTCSVFSDFVTLRESLSCPRTSLVPYRFRALCQKYY